MCFVYEETPEHALLRCRAHEPSVDVRCEVFDGMMQSGMPLHIADDESLRLLRDLLQHWSLAIPVAKLVVQVRLLWTPFIKAVGESVRVDNEGGVQSN